jgi:hypothetical protein
MKERTVRRGGGPKMFGLSTCRIEAKLLKSMDEAILEIERLQKHPGGYPIQARIRLVAAQTAWTEHRAVCPICSK